MRRSLLSISAGIVGVGQSDGYFEMHSAPESEMAVEIAVAPRNHAVMKSLPGLDPKIGGFAMR